MSESGSKSEHYKVDPDPVSIGLAVLGALGSLASIASYLEGRQFQKPDSFGPFEMPLAIGRDIYPSRTTSSKTKFRDRITKLHASLEDLKGRIETLTSLLDEVDFIGETALSEMPFQFGSVRPLLDKKDLSLFFRIQNEVNQLFSKITKDCQALIKLLEDLGTDIPPNIYSKLLQLRSRLNKAIGEHQKFMSVLSLNLACIDNGLDLCSLIREYFESDLESF